MGTQQEGGAAAPLQVAQVVNAGAAATGAPAGDPNPQPNQPNAVPESATPDVVPPESEKYESPEEVALREAERELAERDGGAKSGGTVDGGATETAGEQPAGQPASTAKPTPTGAPPKVVPVAVVLAERKRAQDAMRVAAELQGENRVLRALAKVGDPTGAEAGDTGEPAPSAAEPSIDDQIGKIRQDKLALAKKVDDGEITVAQQAEQLAALEDREWELRTEKMRSQVQQDTRREVIAQDTTLEEHAATLEKDFPIIKALSQEQLNPFVEAAYRQAEAEGKPITAGAAGTKELRERTARLAHAHYAQFFGGGATGNPQSSAAQPGPATGTAPLSADAKARAAKLDLQGRMPPDATNVGAPASGTGVTEAEALSRMDGMTEDEQIRFLDSVPMLKAKILGA